MSTQFAAEGISRRAYAKRRHVTEAAIRKRIADGTLGDAVLVDGRIDPDVADRLLAENTTAGDRSPPGLSAARRRKGAAAIALLRDEVEALERSHMPRDLADHTTRRLSLIVATRLLRIADDIAADVVGKPARTAADIIDKAVFAALTEISETKVKGRSNSSTKRRRGKALAKATLVELATLRADLQARRLEVEHRIKRHEVIGIARWEVQLLNRVIVVKTNVLAMHHKLAPRFENATVAKAKAILAEDLRRIVEGFACKAVSAAELRAAGKSKSRRTA